MAHLHVIELQYYLATELSCQQARLCLPPCSHRIMSGSAASAASAASAVIADSAADATAAAGAADAADAAGASVVPLILAPHDATRTAAMVTRVSESSWRVTAGEAVPHFFGANGPSEIVLFNWNKKGGAWVDSVFVSRIPKLA